MILIHKWYGLNDNIKAMAKDTRATINHQMRLANVAGNGKTANLG